MLTQVRSLSHRRRIMATSWTPLLPTAGGYYPEHWYRSDGGLWQDAGVTPAAADGDVVGRWEDLTANADHVNQAVAASKPTLQNGAGDLLNGHPVVRSDGVDDYLQGAFTTGGAMAQPITIFGVGKSSVAGLVNHFFYDGDDALNRVALLNDGAAGAGAGDWSLYAGTVVHGGPEDANWNIWTAYYNVAASQLWQNGTVEVAGNTGANAMDGITIGARYDATSPWDGDIAEIIIYHANLSNADKNQVGQYLATRYGLAYTDI
jgi:hypothetical protein